MNTMISLNFSSFPGRYDKFGVPRLDNLYYYFLGLLDREEITMLEIENFISDFWGFSVRVPTKHNKVFYKKLVATYNRLNVRPSN